MPVVQQVDIKNISGLVYRARYKKKSLPFIGHEGAQLVCTTRMCGTRLNIKDQKVLSPSEVTGRVLVPRDSSSMTKLLIKVNTHTEKQKLFNQLV